ncbi:MAG: methylmalonate-semialdehyde dehydrogenase (acylating) [Bacteroidetes bacterium RIFCSPLOWO2_02_FULL_36_8]|nr:MAG: methylmalonate-semialdehyde dehydrogenase (acylating) [Bacteroidetes bacterium RIFCSPLOWO2_02_FULL_36_8]OFY71754.1 MAG: methylmalonate-semialdehyde dehydrogenase (acylating) [Bacteroidetes bacterium RIFCSPLOWO2_12_FULL_37_12]
METLTAPQKKTSPAKEIQKIQNYVNGKWVTPETTEYLDVTNSATGEIIAHVPVSTGKDVSSAIEAAQAAFPAWRETPPAERVKYFFRWKNLLEENFEEIARLCTIEHGKTLIESRGDLRRGIDNIDNVIGIPSLIMGESFEDIAKGIDCRSVRRPLGVFTAIAPFNFPPMVPMWFLPYAVACGNTFVLKPSEQVPLSQVKIFELIDKCGFPAGVVNLVNGTKDVVNTFCTHPLVKGVSFVGSSPVAKHVYETGCKHGKRVQALGGAKNFLVAMPDANIDVAAKVMCDSGFGCAGERCLAGSVILAHKDIYPRLRDKVVSIAKTFKVGNGLYPDTGMGPVISKVHKEKVLRYIETGIKEGATLLMDGRNVTVPGHENGFFLGLTIFDNVKPEMTIAKEEIFGPVVCIIKVEDLDHAISIINSNPYANTSSIFTDSGSAAREFSYKIDIGMIGINLGVPAPMAFFSFGGAKESLFGDLKAHGKHSIYFYTDTKTIVSRWDHTMPRKSEQ